MVKKIKVLNLYAGIGGNRKLWKNVEVTAIENNKEIAKVYQDFFPEDKVIVTDAHQYLLDHYKEFDFIWSSPPCPTHSKLKVTHIKGRGLKAMYPDMNLYQEIVFLKHFFKGKWVVENVVSYYEPLIKPTELGNHYFWSNFFIEKVIVKSRKVADRKSGFGTAIELAKLYDWDLEKLKPISGLDKRQILQNCVDSNLSLNILKNAFRESQKTLGDV